MAMAALVRTCLTLKLSAIRQAGLLVAAILLSGPAAAQERWRITMLDAASLPSQIVEETRLPASAVDPAALPDGLIAEMAEGDVARAWYADPTERYGHAILGDAIEAGSLVVEMRSGRRMTLNLPRSEVFEDRYPRLADLDGDGDTEIITIRASLTKGASVTVYGVENNRIIEKATTGFYGRANRWLNIAGIAPFLGIKGNEVAFVTTPHIGGNLFIMRYANGKLVQMGAAENFSNHEIGSPEMRLSAVVDVDGDGRADLAVPSADRTILRVVKPLAAPSAVISNRNATIIIKPGDYERGGLEDIAFARLPAAIDKAIGIQTEGRRGFIVGLENGEVYLVHR